MGFYSPASLISDVRRHGVQVRGVDVNASAASASLETGWPAPEAPGAITPRPPAVRALACQRSAPPPPGASRCRASPSSGSDWPGPQPRRTEPAEEIAAGQPYADLEDFARRTRLPARALEALATAGAFGCFGMSRREALWAAGAAATIRPGQLPGTTLGLTAPPLPADDGRRGDLRRPVGHRDLRHAPDRAHQAAAGAAGRDRAAALKTARAGATVRVAGLVTHRQQPGTARGVVFLSLEDETGMANVICPPQVWQRIAGSAWTRTR